MVSSLIALNILYEFYLDGHVALYLYIFPLKTVNVIMLPYNTMAIVHIVIYVVFDQIGLERWYHYGVRAHKLE